MPADGISLPPKRGGTSARPAGRLEGLGYTTAPPGGRGHDRLWHFSDMAADNYDVRSWRDSVAKLGRFLRAGWPVRFWSSACPGMELRDRRFGSNL